MKYRLFIGENCHQCQDVINALDSMGIDVEIINVDLSNQKPPIKVFAYPALFQENNLLRYGSDIIHFLKKEA